MKNRLRFLWPYRLLLIINSNRWTTVYTVIALNWYWFYWYSHFTKLKPLSNVDGSRWGVARQESYLSYSHYSTSSQTRMRVEESCETRELHVCRAWDLKLSAVSSGILALKIWYPSLKISIPHLDSRYSKKQYPNKVNFYLTQYYLYLLH